MAVRAPIGGVLQEVSAAPDQTVAASAALFSISQVDALWIRVPLFVGERGEVDLTQPVTVRTLGQTSGPAVVANRVEGPPTANPAAATADLFFAPTAANPNLRLGERVSVELPHATDAAITGRS